MQIDYAVLGAFTLLWLAIVPTPGPNTLLIVHLALTAGWRDVAVALAGNLLAIAFYALATLLGLALLLAAAPSVRLGVYVLGGAYLIWVGVRLLRAGLARRKSRTTEALNGGTRRRSGAEAVPAGHPDGAGQRPGAVLPRQHLRRRRHPRRQSGDAARRRRRHRSGQRRLPHPARLAAAARARARRSTPATARPWRWASVRCSWHSGAPRAARAGGVDAPESIERRPSRLAPTEHARARTSGVRSDPRRTRSPRP